MREKTIHFILILFLLIFSSQLHSQNSDSIKCIDGAIDAVQTVNQIVAMLKDSTRIYQEETIGIIDSICNSKKTAMDFAEENSILGRLINFDLGNGLNYKCHFIGNLNVKHVTYNRLLLVKVKCRYSFYFQGEEKIDAVICDFLKSKCNTSLMFGKGDYDVDYFEAEFISTKGLAEFKKLHPDMIFDIVPEKSSSKYTEAVNFINDPSNQLTYGFACSIGGMPPNGYEIFASLFHYKYFDVIEKLLYSPNPVTRLYACDALEYGSKKDLYVLTSKISDRINKIKREETKIECCWGCEFEVIPIKDAVVKAAESKKHLYNNFMFIKDEE